MNKDEHDPVTEQVIGAAIEVHRELGPGLLESIYEEALCCEFQKCDIPFERQKEVPVMYKGTKIKSMQLDLVVRGEVVVELKAVRELEDIHVDQLITYLKIGGCGRGLLINFNVNRLVDGVRRISV